MSESKRSEESCKSCRPIGNTFVNDGSFLEMFRKRMEEEKSKVVSHGQPAPTKVESRARTESKELKTENSEGISDQSESGSSTNASGDKPIIQVLIGLCYCAVWVMLWNKDFSSPVCSL